MTNFTQNTSGVFTNNEFLWTYGRREPQQLKLYPLSFGDQLKISDIIITMFAEYSNRLRELGEDADPQTLILQCMQGPLAENFQRIIAIVADIDPKDDVVVTIQDNVTNLQLGELVSYIWEVNYGAVIKNYGSLFADMKRLTGATRDADSEPVSMT